MIVCNLATYPPRIEKAVRVIERLSPQVDRMNVVLNEFSQKPTAFPDLDDVSYHLPQSDTKDTGKFFPNISHDDLVFFADDDIDYPYDYISKTSEAFLRIAIDRKICGYHASTYRRPRFQLDRRGFWMFVRFWKKRRTVGEYRDVHHFKSMVERPFVVDQVATGTAVMRGRDVPPFHYVRRAERFVDVRVARWCFENDITPVCLARPSGWLTGPETQDGIYETFTKKNDPQVADEIWKYAFRRRNLGASV